MDRIAVLIPCYNEVRTVAKVISDFRRTLPQAVVYVYDNNSTDGTDLAAREAGAVVRYEYRQGKGQVIRSMFRDIEAECYIIADGDDTYPAECARQMANIILNEKADMVIGDRLSATYFQENSRPFHSVGNTLVKRSINFLFHTDISDILTGYRAFSYEFVKTFPVLSKGFEIETEMTIHALDKNLGIENVVVPYRDRPAGSESKLNTYSDGIKVLRTVVRLYKNCRPFQFFGFLGGLMFLLGAVLIAPVFIEYLRTSLVPRIPTLIVSGFLTLGALLSIFCGVILDVLAQQNRQDFELRLNEFHEIRRMKHHKTNHEN
ncbi:Glycosyl transferase family 2 [Caprobacter fermentans]|uniref:Glycosyl transferase family 2 n=1 Tax=Caproicibacter fermentans TaxID=2576756 RepID=A0A6N8HZS3_9FIRM|nr:glycosyltransferase family 2 protein [Caproicibacter fermentans]MVB11326.1 Glycosyl transferase family 2 [Caproicibacter fermentans]